MPAACPISRSTPGARGHSRTARYTGSPAYRQAPAAQTDLLSSGSSCGAALELRLLALPVGVGLLAAESLVDSPSFSMWQHLGRPRYRGQARSRVRFASLNVTATARGQNPQGCRGRRGKPQINRLFCKPTCKPDAARQLETRETQPTEREVICPVRGGHRTRERLPETWETYVVWLITQRSRLQIPPPLLRPEVDSEQGIDLFP